MTFRWWLLMAALGAAGQETAVVMEKAVERSIKLPAEVLPYQRVRVVARVNGIVEKVEVDRGSRVTAGQVLAVLSAPERKAEIAEALARAEAFEAQRAEAEARRTAAESTLEKLKAAAATPGAVAANDIVQAEKAMEAAKAVGAALGKSASAARAAAAALQELESYLVIKSPFEGAVTARLAHPGALAGPAQEALFELEQTSRLRVVVAVPEGEAGVVPRGARVGFTVPAHPGRVFSGTVARVAPSLDAKTRTLPVELEVANGDYALAPGMYPEVTWPVRRARSALWVPATAVVTTTERVFVIRANSGKAEWVNVVRGSRQGDLVEIAGPLSAGDKVVKRATDEIREGSLLR